MDFHFSNTEMYLYYNLQQYPLPKQFCFLYFDFSEIQNLLKKLSLICQTSYSGMAVEKKYEKGYYLSHWVLFSSLV